MKPDSVFKKAFNRVLQLIDAADVDIGATSENALRARIGVSRTTVHKVLSELDARGIMQASGNGPRAGRPILKSDYFPDPETTSKRQHVEEQFMEWMLRGDTQPGTLINELQLARQFGVATNGIREFLIRFSRFGLIEKKQNSGWLFKGFTEAFALELFEIRVMFELRSAVLFAELPDDSPLWRELAELKTAHQQLLREIGGRFHDFSRLDNRLHRLINRAAPNRFIDDFYDVITLIFHYHYQWNKKDELQRNEAAIGEHLAYIDALFSGDTHEIERTCLRHMTSARTTLVRSLQVAA
ncbi:GntR family transcriptional regulator [Phyllobacterium zundukense]|uniref:GntR family transcriptional regulator n=1 Tax=Phyllobacterium zundukense TaxID=1867719 RepID=A0A2N9VQQ1_9HYPH|nr:GntR family transcriptional regulator [Phyllobacterium zundukense]ATU94150.1 GntR family transcriptional regulator [Phyllobacterium zundukense]PIO41819.1 GntR family transcriptional regulator [Phyllobacterium zundukense]